MDVLTEILEDPKGQNQQRNTHYTVQHKFLIWTCVWNQSSRSCLFSNNFIAKRKPGKEDPFVVPPTRSQPSCWHVGFVVLGTAFCTNCFRSGTVTTPLASPIYKNYPSFFFLKNFPFQEFFSLKLCSKLEALLGCLVLPTNAAIEIICTHRNLFLNNSECKHELILKINLKLEANQLQLCRNQSQQ